MAKINSLLAGVVIVALAMLAGVYTATQFSDKASKTLPTLAEGTIPRFFATRLGDVHGEQQRFAQWQGKVLVVNFWAAWCLPCREEMPGFSRLQTKYAANGVQFVGIALDSAENVRLFAKDFPVTYPLLIGEAEGVELSRQLGNSSLALPYTLILTPSGAPYFARLGRLSEQELDALLQKIAHR